ncbi:MAG: DUF547 domain-containing protein [Myxococcota bacterium]
MARSVLRGLIVLTALGTTLPALSAQPPTDGYAQVLKASVKGSKVDYAAVRAQREKLEKYLESVAAADPKTLGPDAKAFYINAYNALVLRQVLREQDARGGKLKSVLDVKGFFDAQKHKVAGEELTLNELEEKRIRKAFHDPRVHFAVNCASASCPPLAPEPFQAATLDARLDELTRAYFATSHGLQVKGAAVSVTKLLEWYAGDFGGPAGAKDFVVKYAPQKDAAAVKSATLSFHEYDWALNAL